VTVEAIEVTEYLNRWVIGQVVVHLLETGFKSVWPLPVVLCREQNQLSEQVSKVGGDGVNRIPRLPGLIGSSFQRGRRLMAARSPQGLPLAALFWVLILVAAPPLGFGGGREGHEVVAIELSLPTLRGLPPLRSASVSVNS
jgi:hypothetical protein